MRGLMERADLRGEVFNIGSTEEVSMIELAERVRRAAGSKSEIVRVPYDEAYGEGFEDMARRVPDTAKISTALGWRPTHALDQMLADVIEHERARRGIRSRAPDPSRGRDVVADPRSLPHRARQQHPAQQRRPADGSDLDVAEAEVAQQLAERAARIQVEVVAEGLGEALDAAERKAQASVGGRCQQQPAAGREHATHL